MKQYQLLLDFFKEEKKDIEEVISSLERLIEQDKLFTEVTEALNTISAEQAISIFKKMKEKCKE